MCAAIGVLAAVFAAGPAQAQTKKIERTAAKPIASVQGADTFKAYCASCHGPEAKGNGPAAKALAKAPADLTTIAKRHGGAFSTTDIEYAIRGSNEMVSHGSREMPVWGPVFDAINGNDKAVVQLRVTNLVNYLKSIQVQ
ncbi:MAG TPA: c-type cytochrome [Vicinamibacterales bacterium]|nr:c-type cytochrome [Vicinamibacterales bacterium]